jgi:hypothetical protein
MKTIAGFSILAAALATGAKEQRQFGLEADSGLQRIIESSVRVNAVEFNRRVDLTAPELRDFQMGDAQITQSRIMVWMGDPDSYEVYAHFREGGGEKCMTLSLEWIPRTETWNAVHSGVVDRCRPVW